MKWNKWVTIYYSFGGFILTKKREPDSQLVVVDPITQEAIEEPTDNFKITYKIGELYGKHEIYFKVKYWQIKEAENAEQTNKKPLLPLIKTYSYKG